MKEDRTVIQFRITKKLKEKVEELAKKENRTVSNYLINLIEKDLNEKGEKNMETIESTLFDYSTNGASIDERLEKLTKGNEEIENHVKELIRDYNEEVENMEVDEDGMSFEQIKQDENLRKHYAKLIFDLTK